MKKESERKEVFTPTCDECGRELAPLSEEELREARPVWCCGRAMHYVVKSAA